MSDPVNHPDHYSDHPACEAIELCEELSFNAGCVIKYLWRAGKKGSESELQDLKKALWYMNREAERFNDITNYPGAAAAPFGVPNGAKKLFAVVSKHPATSEILRRVLDSLMDDNEELIVTMQIIQQEIELTEKDNERAAQEALARSAQ